VISIASFRINCGYSNTIGNIIAKMPKTFLVRKNQHEGINENDICSKTFSNNRFIQKESKRATTDGHISFPGKYKTITTIYCVHLLPRFDVFLSNTTFELTIIKQQTNIALWL